MRVKSEKLLRNGGYLHRLRASDYSPPERRVVRAEADAIRPDLAALAARYAADLSDKPVALFAGSLCVSAASLRRLCVGRDERGAWTFPMRDARGRVVGIRLRLANGRKLAVTGSKDGLFIPEGLTGSAPLLLAEGASDAAALVDLGFNCIGRPSCLGGIRQAVEYVRLNSVSEAVIVSDADDAGRGGAKMLATALAPYCMVKVIEPPPGVKDAREWKRRGATRVDVLRAIFTAKPLRLRAKVVMR